TPTPAALHFFLERETRLGGAHLKPRLMAFLSLWFCCRVRNRCGRLPRSARRERRAGAPVGRERHTVGLPRVAPDLRDERLLLRGAGLEPAFAMNRFVHDSSRRR